MTNKPENAPGAFTVPLLLGIGVAFIGGSIEGPTWAKLALIFAAIVLILFSAVRQIRLSKAQRSGEPQSGPGAPGPHA